MSLSFRNLEITPDDPVEAWGVEGVLAAIDRGDLNDWRRLAAAVRSQPWGGVARTIEVAASLAEDTGAARAVMAALEAERQSAAAGERAVVAARLAELLEGSGLTMAEFAEALGTSRSRMHTYVSGRVCPSAAFLVRAEMRFGDT